MKEKILLSLVVDESEDLAIHLLPDIIIEADYGINPSAEFCNAVIRELNPEAYHEHPARAEINTVVERIKKHLREAEEEKEEETSEEETEETEEEEKKEE